jgi:hypothetical protein
MSLTAGLSGTISLTDSGGSQALAKAISASFVGAQVISATGQNIGTSPVTITIPTGTANFVYIKNTHASQTLTVTWTPASGSSNVVCTLQAGAILMLVEAVSGSGITALSLTASGASTPVDYFLAG